MANKNSNLGAAKTAKNDEFYTQYEDIEREMNAYLEYDENVFRGKTVLLPCDDPEWSNFTKYFAQNFERFGLKKLISTSYAPESKKIKAWAPTLFETEAPQYNKDKSKTHGKIFILDSDTNGSGRIDVNDLRWEYLEGDGDFRSEEVTKLRDESDCVITNPPFSLFREFFSWIMNGNKLFVVIAHQNVIKYNTVFPHIRDNRIWLGNGFSGGATHFFSPYQDIATAGHHINGMIRVSGVVWLTNIEHGKRHEPLKLMSEKDNIKYSRHKEIKGIGYLQYDNLDAIEVPFSDAIPNDYMKLMGVPITFLDKYCPEQFEIIGIFDDKREDLDIFIKGTPTYVDEQHKRYVGPVVEGKALYSRILIRKK